MSKQEIKQAIQQLVKELPLPERIDKIRLFGSYLHNTAKQDSDIDLIIDFSQPVSLFELEDIANFFKESLHHDVDITTPDGLSRHIKTQVLSEAEVVYEKN